MVNPLVKLAQEKVWLGELTIAVDWDVKNHTKQTSANDLSQGLYCHLPEEILNLEKKNQMLSIFFIKNCK